MIKRIFSLFVIAFFLGSTMHSAEAATISEQSRIIFGTLQYLDKNGRYLTIKRDNGGLENYYFQRHTLIINDKGAAGLSALIEGDRLRLQFTETGSSRIDKVEVLNEEKEIESIRKGKIHQLDALSGKIKLSDSSKYTHYSWGYQSYYNRNSTFQLSNDVLIYYGGQLLDSSQFRYYSKFDAFFVTSMSFTNEIVQRVIINRSSGKDLQEEITFLNEGQQFIELKSSGKVNFHEGTIFIRNNRIVDPVSIMKGDKAFIATDNIDGKLYASIVYITK
ncbi:hypothetical protein QTL97_07910 [Sporosarcina thermotolerans]|uniref:Copper amine oxidase-like N-terminal domain-containing protein n=1 Tax=Sporosarcina thermotolerans TaxID=633404 RepID=A0AAW9A9J6_9BACL|nr:hypothetical protein [Sporosarcina thermotolerans]MDW0116854.1 hypothetical protein [Sporosarcina thermotolerans]